MIYKNPVKYLDPDGREITKERLLSFNRAQNTYIDLKYETLREECKLAREVIELRKQRNMTQKELAEKAGTSQPAIARVESGLYHNVSMSFMRKIGKALGALPEIHLKVQG